MNTKIFARAFFTSLFIGVVLIFIGILIISVRPQHNIKKQIHENSFVKFREQVPPNSPQLQIIRNGSLEKVIDLPGDLPYAQALNADGTKVAVILTGTFSNQFGIEACVVTLATSQIKVIHVALAGYSLNSLMWSPDGKYVAFAEMKNGDGTQFPENANVQPQGSLYIFDTTSGLVNSMTGKSLHIPGDPYVSPLYFTQETQMNLIVSAYGNVAGISSTYQIVMNTLAVQKMPDQPNSDKPHADYGFYKFPPTGMAPSRYFSVTRGFLHVTDTVTNATRDIAITPIEPSTFSPPSPDGRWVVYEDVTSPLATNTNSRPDEKLTIVNVDAGSSQAITVPYRPRLEFLGRVDAFFVRLAASYPPLGRPRRCHEVLPAHAEQGGDGVGRRGGAGQHPGLV